MIVRILGEGQYEVDEGAVERMHELDEGCEAALQEGDGERFHSCYTELLEHLRSSGSPLADDDLRASDLMLPPPDVTVDEARRDYSEHGLLPD